MIAEYTIKTYLEELKITMFIQKLESTDFDAPSGLLSYLLGQSENLEPVIREAAKASLSTADEASLTECISTIRERKFRTIEMLRK